MSCKILCTHWLILFKPERREDSNKMDLPQSQAANEIFVLDDDEDIRKTLCLILDSGGYKGVCFADESSLLEAIRQRCPAAIMLDVKLRGRSGLEILKGLKAYTTPVVMISGCGDIPTAVAAIKGGALDFFEKPFRKKDVLDRLKKIVAVFAEDRKTVLQRKLSSFSVPGRAPLTRREREVLEQMAMGASNKIAAQVLGISSRTVEDHRCNMIKKLGVKNSVELLAAVLK